jgi:hypothetical protein
MGANPTGCGTFTYRNFIVMAHRNKINYYNNGLLISSSKLGQPPDMLTDATLRQALNIILQVQDAKPQPPCYVEITQGDKVLKTTQLEPP